MVHRSNSRDEIAPHNVQAEVQNGHFEAINYVESGMKPQRFPTSDSVTIPRETFEKMYLNPPVAPRNPLRKVVGNPTSIPLLGFVVCSTALGCSLMGWRGAGHMAAADVGMFYFYGGTLQIIGMVMEWIIGNTFVSLIFATYGAFWLTFGATLTPFYNAKGAYTDGLTGEALKAGEASYYSSFAFYIMCIAIITFYFVIASVRTNLVLVLILFFVDLALMIIAGSFWVNANGQADTAAKLQEAGGAFIFIFAIFGWYLELVLVLQSVDFPFSLPVMDLSTRIKSAEDLKRDKAV